MAKFDKKQFLKEVGRIKYMQQSDMQFPPVYTRRMLKRMDELGITHDDIKPVKFDMSSLLPKPQRRNEQNKRIYKYCVNGVHKITGTKEEIAEQEGLTVPVISQLISKGGERRIGQGNKKGDIKHSCVHVPKENKKTI